MNGGRIAAEWLKAQGVTHVFALCGEHVLPLLDACEETGIRVIGTRHEQGAVLAAEAFARVSGKPGVDVVTAGPGVTNAMTGLAVAQTCGSPVVGPSPLRQLRASQPRQPPRAWMRVRKASARLSANRSWPGSRTWSSIR